MLPSLQWVVLDSVVDNLSVEEETLLLEKLYRRKKRRIVQHVKDKLTQIFANSEETLALLTIDHIRSCLHFGIDQSICVLFSRFIFNEVF